MEFLTIYNFQNSIIMGCDSSNPIIEISQMRNYSMV